MMHDRMGTLPLPLALHLAMHTVIGLFCMLAGPLNFVDPWVKGLQGLAFLTITGLSWGYVFGIVMGRREVVMLGFVLSFAYVAAGIWQFTQDWRLGALLVAIGVYGLGTLSLYRRRILEA